MYWIYLVIAGMFETVWAVALKYSQGFSRPIPSFITFIGMTASFYFLAKALKGIQLGMGYAVWTGIGVIGTFIVSIILFNDYINLAQGICIFLIFAGIVGLRLLS
ncbi:hypothetical protein NZ47_05830 [Anaerovibrio lipolyticus]|uniref:Multidrug transporter n=1 Tax=Anaerovibrio lipolyticus TaxID=82374 RepID=A0A0B2JXG0_9FIRM|nr:multidrug efflux SMR transporter [Anaerovibrio lipolyticus]KHM52254.1 hypothetical protein NZ47_05830 [Anaerovibrio lipolyticus]